MDINAQSCSNDKGVNTPPRQAVTEAHAPTTEPCIEKTCFCICTNKDADQLCGKSSLFSLRR